MRHKFKQNNHSLVSEIQTACPVSRIHTMNPVIKEHQITIRCAYRDGVKTHNRKGKRFNRADPKSTVLKPGYFFTENIVSISTEVSLLQA